MVVAVLLDNFWAAARKEKESEINDKLLILGETSEGSPLDPLLNTFMTGDPSKA